MSFKPVFILKFMLLAFVFAGPAGAAEPDNCKDTEARRFICGPINAEDIEVVPGTDWVITSGMDEPGHLYLVDRRDSSWSVAYPGEKPLARHDKNIYGDCPGPIAAQNFGAHGINIRDGAGGVHTLYSVNHGARESIEVFEVDTNGPKPVLTWIGCIIVPEGSGANSLAPIPGGGIVVSNWKPAKQPMADWAAGLRAKYITGNVMEWMPGKGWSAVFGSESSGPNGLEATPDGQTLFIVLNGHRSLSRLQRGKMPVPRDDVAFEFGADNVKWAPDGSLLVAGVGGNGNCDAPGPGCRAVWVARVNPATMESYIVVHDTDTAVFGSIFNAATAIQVGDEIWVGPSAGDRIAIYPSK